MILAVVIPTVLLAYRVTQIAMAASFSSHTKIEDLQQAIALDPGNAAYYHKLGLVYAYSPDRVNFRKSIEYLRKATDLNPHKALYWSDLAEVCDTINDLNCSNLAVDQALSLSPMTPRFQWMAGNHYLQTGHIDEGLEYFRRLLTLDTTYAQPVFRVTMAAVGNPETVYQKALPSGAGPELKLAYLEFASSRGDIDFANQLWNQLSTAGLSCKFAEVKPYLEQQLSTGNIRQAKRIWNDLEEANVISKSAFGGKDNLVYNGGFEDAPLNAGFGWHIPNTPNVEIDFQDPSAYRGSRCLRVDFAGGQNLESEAVYELITVEAHRSYHLQAYVRSNDITSQSGPRLRVADAECPTCLNVSTAATVGTTSWHLLTLDFTTGPKTRLIRLSVWRPRSRTFPMEISGSFWLDDVSIEALHSPQGETVSSR